MLNGVPAVPPAADVVVPPTPPPVVALVALMFPNDEAAPVAPTLPLAFAACSLFPEPPAPIVMVADEGKKLARPKK
jgi:hypothetical protein